VAQELAPALSVIQALDRRGVLELVEALEGELAKEGDKAYQCILLILLKVCERRLKAFSDSSPGAE